jgi:hypothetical protein
MHLGKGAMLVGTLFMFGNFTGCATATTAAPSPGAQVIATTDAGTVQRYGTFASDNFRVNAAPDVLLTALRDAYTELGVDIGLWDPQTREVGNRKLVKMHHLGEVALSRYFGCGDTMTGPAADSYSLTMSLVSQVIPDGSGSRIITKAQARAQNITSSNGSVACETMGAFETKLDSLVVRKTGG